MFEASRKKGSPAREPAPDTSLRIGRVYDPIEAGRGHRVLVDRLWPRGLRKEDARLDHWAKDLAPSTQLRRFYDHRAERFEEFGRRYREELRAGPAAAAVDEVLRLADGGTVTLLTATKDLETSGAAVLADHLSRMVARRHRRT